MMHMIGDIILALTVLLLAILNHNNGKRINDLEKRVEMLTIVTRRKEP